MVALSNGSSNFLAGGEFPEQFAVSPHFWNIFRGGKIGKSQSNIFRNWTDFPHRKISEDFLRIFSPLKYVTKCFGGNLPHTEYFNIPTAYTENPISKNSVYYIKYAAARTSYFSGKWNCDCCCNLPITLIRRLDGTFGTNQH